MGQDNQGAAIGGRGRRTYEEYGGYGTKNIVIEGNGTVNTNAQIGSGYRGGASTEHIMITGEMLWSMWETAASAALVFLRWYGTSITNSGDAT